MIYVVLEGNVWKQKHVGTEARRRKERFEQVEDESAQTGGGEREAGYKGVECYLLGGTIRQISTHWSCYMYLLQVVTVHTSLM